MTLTKEQIDAAVNWWGRALKAPSYNQLSPEERAADPDSARQEFMGRALVSMLRTQHPITDEQIDTFKTELRKVLDGTSDLQVKLSGPELRELAWLFDGYLGVDYGPCITLRTCAERAGIDDSHFPIKTGMRVNRSDGRVSVGCGYGAPWVYVNPDGSTAELVTP